VAYTISAKGDPFHTCAHCNFILDGFNVLSDRHSEPTKPIEGVDVYNEALKEYDLKWKVLYP